MLFGKQKESDYFLNFDDSILTFLLRKIYVFDSVVRYWCLGSLSGKSGAPSHFLRCLSYKFVLANLACGKFSASMPHLLEQIQGPLRNFLDQISSVHFLERSDRGFRPKGREHGNANHGNFCAFFTFNLASTGVSRVLAIYSFTNPEF